MLGPTSTILGSYSQKYEYNVPVKVLKTWLHHSKLFSIDCDGRSHAQVLKQDRPVDKSAHVHNASYNDRYKIFVRRGQKSLNHLESLHQGHFADHYEVKFQT